MADGAKTKALISCAVTAQLICAFVFALAKKSVFPKMPLKLCVSPPLFLKWSESFHMRGILRSDKFTTALHGNWVPSVSILQEQEKGIHYT